MAELNSVITTVLGISNRLEFVILAEIRNINTFTNPAQLQSAIQKARYSSTFKAYFKTKLLQGKHCNIAISHVAKKLIRVLLYLFKNNITFDEDKLR